MEFSRYHPSGKQARLKRTVDKKSKSFSVSSWCIIIVLKQSYYVNGGLSITIS